MEYFENTLELSDAARERVQYLRAAQRADGRVVVSPDEAARMLSVSGTCLREMLDRNEIGSFLDGRLRRVIVASLFDRLVRKAIESYPLNGAPKKFTAGWQGRLGPKAQRRAAR
jgi:excisionase family DNA binding protein